MRLFNQLLLAAVLVLAATTAQADIDNGGFETGDFTSWETIENASVVGDIGSVPPTGDFQALVFSPDPDGSDVENASEVAEFLGTTEDDLESFLEVVLEELFPDNFDAEENDGNLTNGSGIKQSFSAMAGEVLCFTYNFLTEEAVEQSSFFDPAVLVLTLPDGMVEFFLLGSPGQSEGDFVESNVDDGDDFAPSNETGFMPFSLLLPEAGDYTLAIGTFNTSDEVVSSGVLVDDFEIKPIPLPGAVWLLGAGAAGIFGLRRRG